MKLIKIIFSVSLLSLLSSNLCSQDTIYVSVDNTVYLTFPEKIELVDIGKFEEYIAEVSNENLIKVKAITTTSKASTIMVKYGANFKQFFLQVVEKPTKFHYDFGMSSSMGSSSEVTTIKEEKSNVGSNTNTSNTSANSNLPKNEKNAIKEKCQKMIDIPTEEETMGFISKFLQAAVTVIRNDKDNTYLKIVINNKSTIPYKFDFISFQYFQSMNKGFGKQKRKAPQDVYPLLDNNNQTVSPLTTQKVVYVIPSFALANNGYLLINFREKDGDRVLKIKVSSGKIQSAGIIN
jgi:hypothetical protein